MMRRRLPAVLVLAALVALAAAAFPAFANQEKHVLTPERLDEYVARFKRTGIDESVTAFAAGGQQNFLKPGTGHVVVFFYPTESARDFMLFLNEGADADPADLASYEHVFAPTSSMFSGEMQRFEAPWHRKQGWVRITFVDRGTLYLSPPVRVDSVDRPSVFDPDFVTLSWKDGNPEFSWKPEDMRGGTRYLQVVSDPDKAMLTGTWTAEPRYLFPDTSNVVANLRDDRAPAGTPALRPEGRHAFLLLAIDDENWVTAISAKIFEPPAATD